MSNQNGEVKQFWKTQRDTFKEALVYLDNRRKGYIRSFQTPWAKFNDAGISGIEWNSTIVIAGRPGSGKTLIKDQIVREAFVLNKGEDFRVLEFQFEMLGRVSAVREYSSVLGKSYKYLCSAESSNQKLTDQELHLCFQYAQERVKYPIDVVDEACTAKRFEQIVESYMQSHSSIEEKDGHPVVVYKKTLITIDHSVLMLKEPGMKDNTEMLYQLGPILTKLKRKYPIIFIVLNQLLRSVDSPERNEEGTYGNHILESDIFGGDALVQHADMVVGLNRPGKQKIQYYGPDRYIIMDDKILVMHFIKCRNGDVRMSFFKAEFEKMSIVEIATPPQQGRKMKAI